MIYLDYAATTPVAEPVIQSIEASLREDYGNPSSIYQKGKAAKRRLNEARETLAELLGVSPKELYFTSGATEANNWALRSQAFQARGLGRGEHIVASSIEHPAVMNELRYLEGEGFQVTYLDPDETGQYTVDAFQAASQEGTIGWVAMAVNNEVGSILPTQALGEAAQGAGYWFHVDTVQAFGSTDLDFGSMPITSFAGAGHKVYAPKGIGFLVYRPFDEAMTLSPLLHGGGQESQRRSGTENLPYIVGMTEAFRLIENKKESLMAHYADLQAYLFNGLDEAGLDYAYNGDPENHVANINNLWLKGQTASQALIRLDLAGIYVSAGSACSAGTVSDSPILKAYYPETPERWHESLRISFGKDTTTAELDQLITALKDIQKG